MPETTTFANIPSSGVNTTLQTKYKRQLPSSYQVGNNQEIIISYDAEDVPTQVGDLGISRDANTGFLAGTSMGNLSTSQTYDGFGATATTSAKFGSDELYGVSYSYDALGRIISSTESILGESHLRNYTYDGDDYLARAEVDGATTIYTYDANGNRLNNQAFYDVQDRLVMDKDFLYSYTPRGSLKTKTKRSDGSNVTSYDYDLEGHLRQVALPDGAVVSYGYDGYGRMVSRRQGNSVVGYIYKDQLEPIATVDATGNITAEFVYATKAHVPDYMLKNGKTYRIISDERGSVRLVVDASTGSIAQRIDYDAWGKVLADSNPGFQPFAYAGGIYDGSTGLVKFGARDYDAGIGRWLSKDPIGFNGGTNLSAYAGSDPLNFVDLDGLKWVYRQSTGAFGREDSNKKMSYEVGRGYSRAPGNVNRSSAENLANRGPIPKGKWEIGQPYGDQRLGHFVFPLEPYDTTNTYDRSLFRIHGDNNRGNRSASEGCPILGPKIREKIAKEPRDKELEVVP